MWADGGDLVLGDGSRFALGETQAPRWAEAIALWVVSRKGKAAGVKDVEVMAAARGFGLVDSKVVGFSDSLTTLRFTRRKSG